MKPTPHPSRRQRCGWAGILALAVLGAFGPAPAVVRADPLDNWTSRASNTTNQLLDITYGHSTFVAVGDLGTVAASPDAVSWATYDAGTTNRLYGISYGNGIFVAVGDDGTVLTSATGHSWLAPAPPTTDSLYGITYVNGAFWVAGDNGTILTSTNGVDWTDRLSGTSNRLWSIAFGNGTFVAVGSSGTIQTSADGTNWTSQISGTTAPLYTVIYANGTFVTMGYYGAIFTSPDGSVWTDRTWWGDSYFYRIVYATDLFVAAGGRWDNDLANNAIQSSPDGAQWTPHTLPTQPYLYGIAYGRGTFVAVGSRGKIIAVDVGTSSTIDVANLNDSGPGSLRQAIQDANPGDTIRFGSAETGTVSLTTGELLIDKNLTIAGPGAASLAVNAHQQSRVFNVSAGVTAAISNLTVSGGHASDGRPVNPGANGGGLSNSGTLTLTACAISGNTSGAGGAGGPSQQGGPGGNGGAIYNAGTLRLVACTVSGNSCGAGGDGGPGAPAASGGHGGHGGGLANDGTLTLVDCTVSGNVAGRGGRGGGFSGAGNGPGGPGGAGGSGGGIYSTGTLVPVACTVSGNAGGAGGPGGSGSPAGQAGPGGSGGGLDNPGAGALAQPLNTIIATNAVDATGAAPDVSGAFFSQGHNLVGIADGSTGFGVAHDLVGSGAAPLDPRLGPLTDNGGPTATCALLPGSPAIDAGDDAVLAPPNNLATDQRGQPRQIGGHVDIGAFEAAPPVPSLLTLPATAATSATATLNGSVNPNGSATAVYFDWGVTTNYGAVTLATNIGSGTAFVAVAAPLTALSPNLTYHYRVAASNSFGLATGADESFTTPPPVNHAPVITAGPTVTNARLSLSNLWVIVVGDTNLFAVTATDADGDPLSYDWNFGDGATSSGPAPSHVYAPDNCRPYPVTVAVSDGQATVTGQVTVVAACLLQLTKLQVTANFAKTNADTGAVKGTLELPASYNFASKMVTLDVGGAQMVFALGSKGTGRNGSSTFAKPVYNKKTSRWAFSATLKNGSWQTAWAESGMIKATIKKPGTVLPNFAVILAVDTEAFIGTTNLHYTATATRSGTAK